MYFVFVDFLRFLLSPRRAFLNVPYRFPLLFFLPSLSVHPFAGIVLELAPGFTCPGPSMFPSTCRQREMVFSSTFSFCHSYGPFPSPGFFFGSRCPLFPRPLDITFVLSFRLDACCGHKKIQRRTLFPLGFPFAVLFSFPRLVCP